MSEWTDFEESIGRYGDDATDYLTGGSGGWDISFVSDNPASDDFDYEQIRYDKHGNIFKQITFLTFNEAKEFATTNPGSAIARMDNDQGFVVTI
jgi:hypothetical protein